MLWRFLLLTLALCGSPLGAAEGPKKNDGLLRPVISDEEKAAGRLVDDLDRQEEEYHKLAPAARETKEARLGPTLEEVLKKVAGTKYENKALYWLALWRMTYASADGVDGLLDRLDDSKSPAFKAAGQYLRVQLRLRQGKITDARHLAEGLAAKVPEFKTAVDLVAFHERVGQKAPRTAGHNLISGPDDPAAAHPESWLLYVFIPGVDADSQYYLGNFLSELAKPEYQGRIRPVCVTFAGKPLDAAAALRELPGMAPDVLWANPNRDGDAQQWQADWGIPSLPACALIGPQRAIMAVQFTPADLRPLVGADKAAAGDSAAALPAPSTAEKPGPRRVGWGGKL